MGDFLFAYTVYSVRTGENTGVRRNIPGWSPEPSKLMPWDVTLCACVNERSTSGLVETFVDQFQLTRNEHPQGSGNQENSNLLAQPNLFAVVFIQPSQGSFPDHEHLATHSPSMYWRSKPGASKCAFLSYKADQQEQLRPEIGEANISDVYSLPKDW